MLALVKPAIELLGISTLSGNRHHDPCTIACLIDPEIVQKQHVPLAIELRGK